VMMRSDQPIGEIVTGADNGSPFVLTYLNFGDVNTYGFDLGLGYQLTPALTANLNYSYFGYDLDTTDLKNDGNRNGKVTPDDLPINTPEHKLNGGLTYSQGKGFFGSVWVRWVQAYDYFSGINVAAATNRDVIIGGTPLVEDARVGRYFNYGPLGGFTNVDLAVGYKFPRYATIGAQVTNLFDSEVREFTGAPPIGRLYSVELKIDLPAIGR
jgi:outer membrane receptor for ferrienterochelin and colicins